MFLIGKIANSVTPYYDVTKRKNLFKKRPVLIIGEADSGDYNVLPISKVSKKQYLSPDYDISVKPTDYPNLKLTSESYVRVHKQTTVNHNSVNSIISDMKASYPALFQGIMDKLKIYNDKIYNDSIK